MDDKAFELLTKMYSEITSRLDIIEKKLDEKADKSDIIRLESKIDSRTEALFDGYKQNTEKLDVLEDKIDGITAKVEKQDVEIRVIKGGK